MHILCQCFTFGVIVLFRLTIVNNEMKALQSARQPLLAFKAGVDNGTLTLANVTEDLVANCAQGKGSMAGYHPDLHIIMLFLWLSIATPPIWTNVWRMYIVATMPTEYEAESDSENESGESLEHPME